VVQEGRLQDAAPPERREAPEQEAKMIDKAARQALREQKRHNRQLERVQRNTAREHEKIAKEAVRRARTARDGQAYLESGQHLRDNPSDSPGQEE